MNLFRKLISGVLTLMLIQISIAPAHARIIFVDDTFENDSETYEIGTDDDAAATNLTLQFGGTNGETLAWDFGNTEFDLSDDLNVTGGVTASGTITANGSLDANGAVTLGDGGDDIAIDSDDWDITSAGVLNGFTGFDATTEDTIEAAIFDADAENITGVWEVQDNVAFQYGTDGDVLIQYDETTDDRLEITGTNASVFIEDNLTVDGTFDANGVVTIGDNGDTVAIDSSDWDISATGDFTGAGAITADGLITGTAGATLSGAVINLNANSNFAVNVATGTSTGAITIGGGSNDVSINSNDWDITSAGALNGFTGGDATTENTFEAFIFDADAESITGVWEVQDDINFQFGNDADFAILYDETTDDRLEINSNVAATTTVRIENTNGANVSNLSVEGSVTANSLTDGTVTIAGGAINGATSVDATTEDTIEATIFDADGESITGVWEVQDNVAFQFGNDANVLLQYDETTDDRFEITGPNADVFIEDDLIVNTDATVNGTFDANGVVTIGDNGDTVTIDSSDWDISATGDQTGIGAITMDGLLTGTAGATLSGAVINLNASSNFAVNIGTGSTTAAVTIGGNSNTVEVNSSNWDVSTAGVGSGFTGFTSTGTVDFSGASRLALHQGAANPGTCTEGDFFYNTTTNYTQLCTATNTWTPQGRRVPDMYYFPDTTTDTVVDNNTTDYWDEAAENDNQHPNITPISTNSEILIMVTIQWQPNDANDRAVAVRLEREIGADPTCNSSTQIGHEFGWMQSDTNVPNGMTGVFVDSPGTTSNVTYTICSDTQTVDLEVIQEIHFTLYEMENARADLAEVYATNDLTLQSGDLVSFDPMLRAGVKKTTDPSDPKLLGVVSTAPAKTIGGTDGEGLKGVPIALVGRVPIKVSIENGKIKPGDMLTSSSTPGVAMKATKPGYVIGRAFGGYDNDNIGMVLGFMGTHFADPRLFNE